MPASDEFWRRTSAAASLRLRPVPPPAPASVNFISIALIVSSCTKLFPILLVIWNPETLGPDDNPKPSSTSAMATFTEIAVSMVTALPMSTPPAAQLTPETMDLSPAISTAREGRHFPTPRLSALSSSVLDPLLSVMLSVTNTYLVWLNNIEALYILLDCGYLRAMMMAMGGQAARWIVERTLLNAIGL
ncbi:hypothetical protein AAP_02602 [Ascosphaera apis ARSEF 7405]|uniref:Protein ARV n=1 Tax=Ascosphaera apis ARSEF 7405 TaxID=392613 RepID=A0A167ZV71_9EURO|nr:hypothetical protein AAP_02602 [Ascosphaera apis ARSEF 7405]